MKYPSSLLLTFIAISVLARSQNEPVNDSTESAVTSTTVPVTARILGEIPDETPPQPARPKSVYRSVESDVLDTSTHEQGGRTITVQRIKPVALPAPPEPAPASTERQEQSSERVAGYQDEHERLGLMSIGATVYRSDGQPPRTLIKITPEGGGEAIELWSSADMALIAGGINSFQDSSGKVHHLMIAWSNVHIDRSADSGEVDDEETDPPVMPDFPAGKATFQIVGDYQPDTGDLVAIQSLHDLYNSEYARLLAAYEGRESARIEHEAWLKANPPQPKNITLSYWRIAKPAAGEKGGSR